MTPDGVRKPAWFAYKYLNRLGEAELASSDDQAIVAINDDTLQVLAWSFTAPPEQDVSNRPFYRRVRPARPAAPIRIQLSGLTPGLHEAQIRRVDFRNNDAYTAYLEMGRPKDLTQAQIATLNAQSSDAPLTRPVEIDSAGRGVIELPMLDGDVVLVEIPGAVRAPD